MSGARGKLIVYMCSLIESRNFSTVNHCEQIKKFTAIMLEKVRQFCPEYELDEKKCENIILASATHDIGKISISDKILNKPGRLTEDEFMVMKNHTLKGKHIFENMLQDMDETDPDYELFCCCREICMFHHERFDGRGYPDGLSGDDIPIAAQVVSVADVFDALVSKRSYKPELSVEKALRMIENGECGCFNPLLIECLKQAAEKLKTDVYES